MWLKGGDGKIFYKHVVMKGGDKGGSLATLEFLLKVT
jgi:hypothetical protein